MQKRYKSLRTRSCSRVNSFFRFYLNISIVRDLLEGGVSRRVVGARGERRFGEELGIRSSVVRSKNANKTRNRTKSSLVAVGNSYVFEKKNKKKRKSARKKTIRRSCHNGTRLASRHVPVRFTGQVRFLTV